MKNLLRFTILLSGVLTFSCSLHGQRVQRRLYFTGAAVFTKQTRVEAGLSLRLDKEYNKMSEDPIDPGEGVVPTSSGVFFSLGVVTEPVKQGRYGAYAGFSVYKGLHIGIDEYPRFLAEANATVLFENGAYQPFFRAGAGPLIGLWYPFLLLEPVVGLQYTNGESAHISPYAKAAVHFTWPRTFYSGGKKYYK